MKSETLEALEGIFRSAPLLKAGPVPRTTVETALGRCHFPLPDDYRSFVETFGGAIVGPYPVFGLRKAAAMGNGETSAWDVTEQFVKQRWPGVQDWLIISMDHAGNPIGLAADGRVWISDHDHGQITVIAPSFEDFLRQWCLDLPA